jgi:tRNA (guanine-N7-)-methyltransferase
MKPKTTSAASPPDAKRRLYGRRRGRKLRAGRRALMDTKLPLLRITLPASGSIDPRKLFSPPAREIWLEIGFGAGEHLAAQAAAHPGIGFIGAEVFENGIAKLLANVESQGLGNIRIFADDALLLLDRLADRAIGRVFILFPDPWPKERHKKRRLVSRETLDCLARVMRPGAELRLATDDPDYAAWMEERLGSQDEFAFVAQGEGAWAARPLDWPVTRYEQKAVSGQPARFFLYRRKG